MVPKHTNNKDYRHSLELCAAKSALTLLVDPGGPCATGSWKLHRESEVDQGTITKDPTGFGVGIPRLWVLLTDTPQAGERTCSESRWHRTPDPGEALSPRVESRVSLTSSPFNLRASTSSSKMETRWLGSREGPRGFLPAPAFTVGNFVIILSVLMASG